MHKTIYLVRHGQASAGTHDYDRLSDLGEEQAQLIGRHWLTLSRRPGFVRTGTLRRQRQTAVLAQCLEHDHGPEHLHAGLDEYDHRRIHKLFHPAGEAPPQPVFDEQGRKQDMPTSMSFDTYSQLIKNWIDAGEGINDDQIEASPDTEFESWNAFKQRTLHSVREAARHSPEQEIVLYTSGGVISVVTAQIQQLDDSDIPERIWNMKNASITTLGFTQQETLSVTSLNDVRHLEHPQRPELITLI